MVKLYIFPDEKKVGSFLKRYHGKLSYFHPEELTEPLRSIIKESSVSELKIGQDAHFKDIFVRSYIDLVGKQAAEHNNLYWWLTSLSAKNQFGSSLFNDLYFFSSLIRSLDGVQNDVIVIDPPLSTLHSIKQYCEISSIDVEIIGSLFSAGLCVDTLHGRMMNEARKLYFVYNLLKKKLISYLLFRKKVQMHLIGNREYYILRSWFYPRSLSPEYSDSFFGILPTHLQDKGEDLLIIAGIWEDYYRTAKKIAQINNYSIIPQEFFIRYTDPLKVIFDIHFNKVRIQKKIDFAGLDVTSIVKHLIDKEFKSRDVLENLIHYYYIKRILERVNASTFTTTYENYPWEKMCFLSLRDHSPDTSIIGYHHARISYADLTMYLSEYEKDIVPLPDRVNTTGNVTRDFLECPGNYPSEILRSSCALRASITSTGILSPRSRGNILLVLGGIPSRAIATMNFLYAGLKGSNDIKVVLRCHPAFSFERLKKRLIADIIDWNHLSVSPNTDLNKDLADASVVIYDASTISLEALSRGIPIVNIRLNDIITFDPVIGCDHFKWIVEKEEDLLPVLEQIGQIDDEVFLHEQRKAREYVSEYLREVTEERLDEFIVREKNGRIGDP